MLALGQKKMKKKRIIIMFGLVGEAWLVGWLLAWEVGGLMDKDR